MFVRRRWPSILSVTLYVGGLLLVLFVIQQMKKLYDGNQKLYRLQSYKEYLEEVFDYLKEVEGMADEAGDRVQTLNKVLREHVFVNNSEPKVRLTR